MRNPAYARSMKKVIWMGSSKADLKAFPAAVMHAALFPEENAADPAT
jgi:hypothetical protein